MTHGAVASTFTTQAKNKQASKDGNEYIKHHIPGHKSKHLGKRKDKVTYVRSKKTEGDLSRARQQDTR